MYRINCWLPINLGYCLPTMPTPFVIDILTSRFELLHSTGKLLTLVSNIDLFKPGIRFKTLRMILRFQIEISRLMCIFGISFFNQYTYFCVTYIIVISKRIGHILFKCWYRLHLVLTMPCTVHDELWSCDWVVIFYLCWMLIPFAPGAYDAKCYIYYV